VEEVHVIPSGELRMVPE